MFEGSYDNTVDEKGRVAIPAKYREILSVSGEDRVMVTWHFVKPSPCLDVWPPAAWQAKQAKLEQATSSFSQARATFNAVYIGQMRACQLDRQGRILIPQALRQRAQLGDAVTFVGAGSKFQIFSEANYQRVLEEYAESVMTDPNLFNELGI
ncbi:MAG: division/cell wall cluster transcriptional repressor MraZ [Deltaproteobacteria bacterium]|nr:division/cell wall cluster transcriptional repressor MraZ [Deltaproteobacteria bacterium]